jgi:hypothetical protein
MKTRRGSRMLLLLPLAALVAVPAVLLSNGCASSIPNRDPTGEAFPTVTGRSLEEEPFTLPDDLVGQPAVLLIGYKQRTQFDIDRWFMGLVQAEIPVAVYEIPTIPGLAASFASGWIDDGMRSGIPKEAWASVVTLYGSAAKPVAELTGNENGNLTRVIVLDAQGNVVWFDDEGYLPQKALAIKDLVASLGG